MASSKKGKKNKGKTVPLGDFLQETPGQIPSMPLRKSTLNWADEVEDSHDFYESRPSKANVVLPTAPKASRDFDDIIDKIPQDPPYLAYLSNLPYDVDENEIANFFKNMKISNMRIPKDERSGDVPKLKGFGYVEFSDRESLLNALVMSDTTIKSRRIRIEIATDYDNDKRRSGRMDMNRDRPNRPETSLGDWRSGPRTESADNERRGGGGGGGGGGFTRDKEGDNSMWRDGERRNLRETDRPFTRSSDRYNRDDRDDFNKSRGGRDDQEFRSRGRDDRDRDQDYNRSRDEKSGSGFMARRYDDRNSKPFTRNPPPGPRDDNNEGGGEPRQRPKLVLAPRTKPVESNPEPVAQSGSIFGNAKPVDTSARERQIEERLAKAQEQPPQVREHSKERKEAPIDKDKEKENQLHKEKKEKERCREPDKRSAERPSNVPKQDANGVVDKSNLNKRNGEHEKKDVIKGDANDKHKIEPKKREEKKEKVEKEMPKLKKMDPPNFAGSNKFAFLENDTSE